MSYYWSAEESEWASDVMFGDACQLAAIYPGLIRHGMTAFGGKSVLRVETTINDARDIMVYRPKEGCPDGPQDWRHMRKGIADLYQRAQVSQAANNRYLEAMAARKRRLQASGFRLQAGSSRPVSAAEAFFSCFRVSRGLMFDCGNPLWLRAKPAPSALR